jgi:hypothetical protein
MKLRIAGVAAWIAVGCCHTHLVCAGPAIDVVRVDLNPLIDSAARSPEQFAVNIPRAVSSSAQGSWSQQGSLSTWVYSARIATAISMSFHASHVVLPPSAVLTVSTARTTVKYVARDVSRNGLWGRPLPGDTVNFSLTVKSADANRVHFHIDSLQAGYRSLGAGVLDHPHFAQIKAAAATTGCTENYACHVTPANQGPAHATVALIIGNLYQCSGTLLNNTRGDGAPYILTARHCEKGQLDGGNPDAAATVSVYWDSMTPCGSPLGSIYDGTTITQSGATTALEQQDLWLIQLDTPPAASDAYYAGWDAGGASVSGGYTVHHALGGDLQYVEWSGTDVLEQIPGTTLSIAYDSTFWGVVNSLGNIGAGGSGSALFSPNNQVVGSASLARLTGGENTAGACPVVPPPTPSPSTVTALFTALSGVWTSTADRTSSTGNKTLKSLLDPGNTGQVAVAGIATQPITLTASNSFGNTGDPITLTWNAPGATSCVAWGGASGDGWAGTRAASGSLQVTNLTGGTATYALSCQIGNQIGAGSVTIGWNFVTPFVDFSGASQAPLTLGAAAQLNWVSNVQPCVGSGGVAGDGWAGAQNSGSFAFTVTQTGLTPYTITCGTGARTATSSLYVYGVEPYIVLTSNVSQIMVGSRFDLGWISYGTGGSCATSGGSATDGWANANAWNGNRTPTESVAGTYTYTITCTGGGQTSTSSQTVVVNSGPPAISLAASSATKQIYQLGQPYDQFDLFWSANEDGCSIDYKSNSGNGQAVVLTGEGTSGAVADPEFSPGVVTYTMQCGAQTASTTINWVSTAPPASLSVATATWAAHVAYPLTWNASAGPCVASGGAAGDGWAGPKNQSGTQSVSESQSGGYVFTLTCGSGGSATTSNVIVQVPLTHLQIYSMPGSSPVTGLPLTTITWSASVGPCTYLDGSVPNSTGVPVSPSGSATPSPAVAGTYLFNLTCGSGAYTLKAATLAYIPVNAPTTLTASAASAPVDAPVTLTWSSANGICYATGGDGTAPWTGTLGGNGSGSLIVTSRSAGSLTYGIICNNETAQATVNYVAVPATAPNAVTPSVTLSSSASTETAGQSVSLVWSAKNADSCSASGGNPGDGWTGSLAPSGSMTVTETSAGTVIYSITCAGAPPAATASTSVVVKTAAAPPPATTSHGGGGSLDPLLLLLLGVLVGVSCHRQSVYSPGRS